MIRAADILAAVSAKPEPRASVSDMDLIDALEKAASNETVPAKPSSEMTKLATEAIKALEKAKPTVGDYLSQSFPNQDAMNPEPTQDEKLASWRRTDQPEDLLGLMPAYCFAPLRDLGRLEKVSATESVGTLPRNALDIAIMKCASAEHVKALYEPVTTLFSESPSGTLGVFVMKELGLL